MNIKTKLIAQNVDIYEGDGKHPFARTGEIGIYHLRRAGASGVILGHSEVKDQSKVVNSKWKTAIKNGLGDNIVLMGEDWEDVKNGWAESKTSDINRIKRKIRNHFLLAVKGIVAKDVKSTIFGYEPSWGTRGSGQKNTLPPQPVQIEEMCGYIRELISEKYGNKIAKNSQIIYGGSSSPQRTREIMKMPNVDGLILGSAGGKSEWVREIGNEIQSAIKSRNNKRKGALIMNWKAYPLSESYQEFIRVIKKFDPKLIDISLSPVDTELKELKKLL